MKMKFVKIMMMIIVIVIAGVLSTACNPASTTTSETSTTTVAQYQTILPSDAYDRLAADDTIVLLDVRTADEYATGRIPGSQLLPYDLIMTRQSELPTDKDTTIFVYCRSGRRSIIAAETLVDLGYTDVYDLGGIQDWPYPTEIG